MVDEDMRDQVMEQLEPPAAALHHAAVLGAEVLPLRVADGQADEGRHGVAQAGAATGVPDQADGAACQRQLQ
jgi:hypothetical protein